jgi:two-component system nitrogen regulation sensor histidine kinase NtrY
MAADLDTGRARALEAERLRAFRETARQVAHELKNPLTPIRLAVARLQRDPPPALRDTVEVLATESARLEDMARSFSQFGRLPEGPAADVDLGELARYVAKATIPPQIPMSVEVDVATPLIRGHYDALARALTNVLLNAVDACAAGGTIALRVGPAASTPTPNGDAGSMSAVGIVVRDTGTGIEARHLPNIWEPYVTHKPGGTGLGMAIARQTIEAHHGTAEVWSAPGEGTEVRFTLPVSTDTPDGARSGR